MARGRVFRVFSRVGGALGLLVLVAVVVLFTTPFGKGVRDVWGSGAVQAAMAKHEDTTYDSSSTDANLKALYTGMKLFQESEGQYPDAKDWMDGLSPRLILNNLPKKEAEKKLVRPGVASGGFGYALNDGAAGKYVGDIPKGTVLLFESAATGRNAHGDPKQDGLPMGRAVTIEGNLVSL